MSSPDFSFYILKSGSIIVPHWTKFPFNELILMQFFNADDHSINRQVTTCNHISNCNPCLFKDQEYQRFHY